jgi:ATP-binding cassette subfamily C (CFTR/MRP) protein 4
VVCNAAFDLSQSVTERFHKLVDNNSRVYYAFIVAARWLAVWLDISSLGLLSVVVFGSVALRNSLSAGVVGLSVSLLMQLTGMVQWFIRQTVEVETQMVSVERVLAYTRLPVRCC